jgi:hypothetical protein
MANDRLRAALSKAALTNEAVARHAEVDPKTVQKWLAGRVPHPQHRWAVAELVSEDEEFLWPEARRQSPDGLGAAAEIIAAFPHRAHGTPPAGASSSTAQSTRSTSWATRFTSCPSKYPSSSTCSSRSVARVVRSVWSSPTPSASRSDFETRRNSSRSRSSLASSPACATTSRSSTAPMLTSASRRPRSTTRSTGSTTRCS